MGTRSKSREYKEKRGTRSQSCRECKEMKNRGEQEVRAEKAKRRRVEGNKKSVQQDMQREEE